MTHDVISKSRVLIVDDEPSNVRLLERILELNGAPTVRSTTDARETLSLTLEFDPDIILLDLHMPHLDGFAVMELLKTAIPPETYLPVLILTADITPETKRRAFLSGAKDFVTKPLDHTEVVLRIKNLLENRYLHHELQEQNNLLERQVRVRTAQLESTLNQLRTTQAQIIKQERLRALGMMAGGIAHDFNNALTMMLGYGELLLPYLQFKAPEKQRSYLHHMISAAEDARNVVGRLREFYRPAGAQDVRVPVDLNGVVEHAVSLTAPKWQGAKRAEGIQIAMKTELSDIPPVAGTVSELREMLMNFIFNSVDAMPQGGTITIRTRAEGGKVVIAVADTGVGMGSEERARCLEPFFTTKGEHGTGLGLAVVYGIVQRHNGVIEIVSEQGQGTTVTVAFPMGTPATSLTVEAPLVVEVPRRVLVADDQEIICELIAEYLRADGHVVTLANNGTDALEKFKLGAFDVIVTDQAMPGLSGVQVAATIKRTHPDLPVILLTGFGDEMQATGQLPPEVDLVVCKPVSTADLRRALVRVFSKGPSVTA